jgi:integrase
MEGFNMPYWDKQKQKWCAAVMVNGERDRKFFKEKDYKKACAWEEKRKGDMVKEQNTPRPEPKPEDMELRTFFSLYLDYAKLHWSDKTYREKQSLLKELSLKWGGDTPVKDITPAMVVQFLNDKATKLPESEFDENGEVKKSLRRATANVSNKARKNLHALWNWGQEIHDLPTNPVKVKKLPHQEQEQYTPVEKDVLKVLMVATRPERVFLDACLQTGARKSEIFRWRWNDDISFEQRQVRLGSKKNRDGTMEYEWLPMSDDLYDSLMWLWQNKPIPDSPYVFVITKPGQYYGQPFKDRRRFLETLCERAGVKVFKYHAMRRFVGSILADKHKVSAKAIQKILRHKKLFTTEKYLKKIHYGIDEVVALLHNDPETQFTTDFTTSPLGQ